MLRMAALVCSRVLGLMSVIAIEEHPARAKPLATAAPIPVYHEHRERLLRCQLTSPASACYQSDTREMSCKCRHVSTIVAMPGSVAKMKSVD
jgi:hypothetical protein